MRQVQLVKRRDGTYAIACLFGISIMPGSVHLPGYTRHEAVGKCLTYSWQIARETEAN